MGTRAEGIGSEGWARKRYLVAIFGGVFVSGSSGYVSSSPHHTQRVCYTSCRRKYQVFGVGDGDSPLASDIPLYICDNTYQGYVQTAP